MPGHAAAAGLAWAPQGQTGIGRLAPAVAALGDTVYIAGGYNGGITRATVEGLDTFTQTYLAVPDLPAPRGWAGAGTNAGLLYVIGGWASGSPFDTTFAYDPSVRSWMTLQPMPAARSSLGVAATGGKLYAVGGLLAAIPLAANQAYDPVADTWTALAPMPTPRGDLGVAAVGGLVFAIGGWNGTSGAMGTVEAYDPVADAWTPRAPMPTPRQGLAVTVLNGLIYAIGGRDAAGLDSAAVEVYDPAADTWTAETPMGVARHNLGAATVSGSIWAVCGYNGSYLTTTERGTADPALPTLTGPSVAPPTGLPGTTVFAFSVTYTDGDGDPPLAGFPRVRIFRGGVELADSPFPMAQTGGTFAGGATYAFSTTLAAGSDSFVFEAEDWRGGVATGAGTVVTGGPVVGTPPALSFTGEAGYTADAVEANAGPAGLVYTWRITYTDPDDDPPAAGLPQVHVRLGGVDIAGSPFAMTHVAGSYRNGAIYTYAQALPAGVYDYYFDASDATGLAAASGPTAPALPGPTVTVSAPPGGCAGPAGASLGVVTDLSWTARAAFGNLTGATGAAIGNLVYSVGGLAAGPLSLNGAYDPATNTWALKAALPTARSGAGSAVVGGLLYVVGGRGAGAALGVQERYDPVANAWAWQPPMPTPRSGLGVAAVGTLLYAAGGLGTTAYDLVEIFDTVAGTWSTGTPMPTARTDLALVAAGGRLYAIGGRSGAKVYAVVEEFDPVLNVWTCRAPMPTARYGLSAVAIGGTIYAVGGEAGGAFFNVVEAYDPAADAWVTDVPMPTARAMAACAAISGTFWVTGGVNQGGHQSAHERSWGNHAPVVGFTGAPGYTTDGVEPDTAAAGSAFVYDATYLDPDGDIPAAGFPRLRIFKGGSEIAGSPVLMTLIAGAAAAGTYQAVVTLAAGGSDYTYRVEAVDGRGAVAVGALAANLSGPVVTGGASGSSNSAMFTCVYPYPNPCDARRGERLVRFNGTGVPHATIRIYTLDGRLVHELVETAGLPEVVWDVEAGHVAAGSYLWTSESPLERRRGKVTVIR